MTNTLRLTEQQLAEIAKRNLARVVRIMPPEYSPLPPARGMPAVPAGKRGGMNERERALAKTESKRRRRLERKG